MVVLAGIASNIIETPPRQCFKHRGAEYMAGAWHPQDTIALIITTFEFSVVLCVALSMI